MTLSRHPARATARRLPPSAEVRFLPVDPVDPSSTAMACSTAADVGATYAVRDRTADFKEDAMSALSTPTFIPCVGGLVLAVLSNAPASSRRFAR